MPTSEVVFCSFIFSLLLIVLLSLFIVILIFCFTLKMKVIDYYSKKGVVAELHAEKPPKEVTAEVQKVLNS